ncbi:hypothetical protein Dimus_011391, partial [Dionaea muscipula]
PKFLREQANSFNVFNGDQKLPKKLKPEKVKEVVVATSSISKSSPVKRTTPSQSRRSRSKSPLSPPRISSPEPISAKDKQKAVADDVADDVADTSVKAEVVKVADVAARIVHTPAVADLDVVVDKIVMDVAGMNVPKQDDVVLNELHTPDRCQIPNATDPGSTHVSELWQNWHRNFHEIPQHVVAYVSGIRPDWGSEWWKVRHVLAMCLVAQSHWVLADINLEKWTIEIYDSLAHKTPKSPGHRLASFAGMRTLLPNILDEAEYFKHSGRKRRIEPFKAIRIPPNKVGKQEDGDSCGIWALHFFDGYFIGHAINQRIRQSHIPMLRWHFACQIFANSEPIGKNF